MKGLKGFTPEQTVTMFCQAAVQSGLLEQEELSYAANLALALFGLDAPQEAASMLPMLKLSDMLVGYAVRNGLCEDSPEAMERLSAKLFGLVTPGPRAVREQFQALYKGSPQAATDWFYRLCRANDYIRTRQIAQNILYGADSPSGRLEITVNLSKPEKDPRDIAAARRGHSVSYPKCMLCPENPGYAGRPGYPARQNHRMIPLTLDGEPWYFQYSPYLYYDEHCIVLNAQHIPMHVDEGSFRKMFDFVDAFPHYFIGSNADLPIVGGSILTHDHFQGGRHVFPMDKAKTWFSFDSGDRAVKGSALRWPMSCLRFESKERGALLSVMLKVLEAWRQYSDESLGIIAQSLEPHNAVTPVLRKEKGVYLCYLLLRNNRVSPEHPLGIFHPHAQWHHIKKENIGLIEAMGMFILPGRLKKEVQQVQEYLLGKGELPQDSPHAAWAQELKHLVKPGDDPAAALAAIRAQIGKICHEVLSDTGVFKQDEQGREGLRRFLDSIGMMAKEA